MPPAVRTDIIDVYVFRRFPSESLSRIEPYVEVLQLFRAERPLAETWQPVMGHVEAGETAAACAWRELSEEVGLERGPALVGLWALEQVHPFFMAELDAVVMSPRFAAEVVGAWEPRLNGEHSAHRWIAAHQAHRYFMWPGQVAAVHEITQWLLKPGSLMVEATRIE
jgi:8-oxo-dGTP pyrophosphatase MutT (NUDIX family)